jgi:hypothetical protein
MNVGAITSGYESRLAEAARPEREDETGVQDRQGVQEPESAAEEEEKQDSFSSVVGIGEQELNPDEERKIEELKQRDRDVRAHEQAHKMVGGPYVIGVPNYIYERGPDGKMYAVGGEVRIDVAEVPGDPEATVRKMQVLQRAAMAPSDPSPADYKAAALAAREEAEARREAAAEKTSENQNEAGVHTSNVTVAEVFFGSYDAFPAARYIDMMV